MEEIEGIGAQAALGGRGADSAIRRALPGNCNIGFVVARKGNAPGCVQFSEILSGIAGETSPIAVASVAVKGTGSTASVTGECSGGAGSGEAPQIVEQVPLVAAGAVVAGVTEGTAGRALCSHCHSRFIVASHRHAPHAVQPPEVSGGAAGETVALIVAGVAVVGTGHTATVMRELPSSASRQTPVDLQLVVSVADRADCCGCARRTAHQTLASYGGVCLVVASQRDASGAIGLPEVDCGAAAETVSVEIADEAVEGTGLAGV
jgi:hypothetical protein